jgi:hypothetical protein
MNDSNGRTFNSNTVKRPGASFDLLDMVEKPAMSNDDMELGAGG